MNVDAYLQVYNNYDKADLCLSQFRKIYPDSKLYLVSDDGDDFFDLAKQYNCEYEHSTSNTGVRTGGFIKSEMLCWLSRMYRCFTLSNNEYILYLEDDVYIRREIDKNKVCSTDFVLAGVDGGPSIPWSILLYTSPKYNVGYPYNHGGACGGTIYHRNTFLQLYPKIVQFIELEFDILKSIWIHIGCLDQFMPFIYMTLGHKYDFNKELYEPMRNPNWRNEDWCILHFNCPDENKIFEELKNGTR